MHRQSILAVLVFLALLSPAVAKEAFFPDMDEFFEAEYTFPEGAGLVDVTKPPYNADNTGKTDVTTILQKAVSDVANDKLKRTVYLPNGTYLVSNRIQPPGRSGDPTHAEDYITWQGQSTAKTIIKLQDKAPAYQDRKSPLAVVSTTRERWNNDSFMTNVFNLTIDVGKGNPGAIALTYIGNNQASIRDVELRSSDKKGAGFIGLDMSTRTIPGPALVKRLRVVGFETGIDLGMHQYSMTFEHIELKDQNKVGLHNFKNVCNVRGLRNEGKAPAIVNEHPDGLLVALDIVSKKSKAIVNSGIMYARNIKGKGQSIDEEIEGGKPVSLFNKKKSKSSLNLPVKETPEVPWDDPDTWVSIADFGAKPGDWGDDSGRIQQAIDSMKGKQKTLYFPPGMWTIGNSITVRGNVQRIFGNNAQIHVVNAFNAGDKPCFILEDTKGPLLIERMDWAWTNPKEQKCFKYENRRKKPLILRQIMAAKGPVYMGNGKGDVFFEDIHGLWTKTVGHHDPIFVFNKNESVWARQFNPEQRGFGVLNDGATVWVFGFKTEHSGIMFSTINKGKTEILGALNHDTEKRKAEEQWPCYVIENASMTIIGEQPNTQNRRPDWEIVVRETQGKETRELWVKDSPVIPSSKGTAEPAFLLPLYIGIK